MLPDWAHWIVLAAAVIGLAYVFRASAKSDEMADAGKTQEQLDDEWQQKQW